MPRTAELTKLDERWRNAMWLGNPTAATNTPSAWRRAWCWLLSPAEDRGEALERQAVEDGHRHTVADVVTRGPSDDCWAWFQKAQHTPSDAEHDSSSCVHDGTAPADAGAPSPSVGGRSSRHHQTSRRWSSTLSRRRSARSR